MKKNVSLQWMVALALIGASSAPIFAAKECTDASCATKESSLPLIKRSALKSQLDSVKLVDALDENSFSLSHLKGSVNIPMGSEAKLAPSLLPDKNAKIVVYCMNTKCHASDGVAKELSSLGYKNVSIYREGLQDAISSNFPLEGSNPKEPHAPKTASN
jgi:rhodanese-related sulfurtransferase